jgi:hypothetical protein
MLKVFEGFNKSGTCPICGTNKDGKAVLITIDGTGDGRIAEAMQVHLDCLDLRVMCNRKLIYQVIGETSERR